jgi:hypothetical protein
MRLKSTLTILKLRCMKNLLLLITFAFSLSNIKAQDTLTLRSGENIIVKIIEVGSTEVKFKKVTNINGPIFSTLKSDLILIRYENGSKDDFSSIKIESPKSDENQFNQGYNDATKYYKSYKLAGTAVFFTSAFPLYGWFLGVSPALLLSSASPLDENLDYPDLNLMKNEQYARGYKTQAKNIKRKKIIRNYISGLATCVVLTGLMINALSPN